MVDFSNVNPSDYHALVSQHPLAWIVPHSRPEDAILMPALFEGHSCENLFGHFPLRAPIISALREKPNATCFFLGPHHYISPEWVGNDDWVPTWNFTSVKVTGRIDIQEDKTRSCVERLVEHMQKSSASEWSIDRVEHRLDSLLAQITGFTLRVDKISPRFKLGQDETPETYSQIKKELAGHGLSKWMT